MNFQTSCMILVRDEQQQIELQKWMNGIGWRIRGGRDSKHCFLVADTDECQRMGRARLLRLWREYRNVQGTGGHEQ